MIYSVYLNPTIDKTVYIDNFGIGETNRVQKSLVQGGGKAINLAVVLSRLGVDVCVKGIITASGSEPIYEAIGNIPYDFVTINDQPRTNLKVVDKVSSVTTEINEAGPTLSEEVLKDFESKLFSCLNSNDVIVLTGSLPKGCAPDYYEQLLKKAPCRVVLDASGQALKNAVKEKPFLIKPNTDELGQITGKTYSKSNMDEIITDAKQLLENGIKVCALSMGKDGALIINKDSVYKSYPVVLSPDSTVGAGDSMLAGILSVLYQSDDIAEALKVGTASAAASISLPGTELANKELVDEFMKKIIIEKIG